MSWKCEPGPHATAKELAEFERSQLNIKLDKLIAFRTTAIYEDLSSKMQHLLMRQQAAMQEYLDVLDERLNCWED